MSHAGAPCVLVVDDDLLLRQLVTGRLRSAGYTVIEAGTGEEAAAALLAGANPDILVTDISMPGAMDGWSLAEQCRLLNPAVPIVYMTSGSPDFSKMLDNSRFIQKPYHPDTLLAAIEQITRPA
jgi:CheY-like chemotaxis protein